MIRHLCLISVFILTSGFVLEAQEEQSSRGGMNPELRRRALIMEINAKVFSDGQDIMWTESDSRIAIPGNPVSIRLVGSNVVVVVQFTPIIRRQGNVLVAQGQVWIETPGTGVSYYTLVQTIPMDFNEPIYFFPLGTSDSSIEITLVVNPYNEE